MASMLRGEKNCLGMITFSKMAVRNGYDPIVKLLLEAGAYPDKDDNEGITPLCMAAEKYNYVASCSVFLIS